MQQRCQTGIILIFIKATFWASNSPYCFPAIEFFYFPCFYLPLIHNIIALQPLRCSYNRSNKLKPNIFVASKCLLALCVVYIWDCMRKKSSCGPSIRIRLISIGILMTTFRGIFSSWKSITSPELQLLCWSMVRREHHIT